jgi:predicted TIM-barrel fold metal-dependent hydrolase
MVAEAWDTIDRYMILSSDTHAGASLYEYRPYLDGRWRDDFDGWAKSLASPYLLMTDAESETMQVNWDSDRRLALSDAECVTGEVIFPNTLPPFYDVLCHLAGVPWTAEELERRWAGLQAHNRWLVDFCGCAPQRRRGLIQLLPNDMDAAVAEVRWAKGTGVIGGVMIPAIPANHPVQPLFHPRYEPLWAVCAELDMPVHQHQGTGSPEVGNEVPVATPIFFTELDLWARRTLRHLILGGVFERHPGLKVVWTEMWGIRWVLEELAQMDRRLRQVQTRYRGDPRTLNFSSVFASDVTDGLSLTPTEYFARNCYVGASLLPRHEVRYCEAVGIDRIMWGNDFPHPEGTTPYTTEGLRATLFDVPEADCRRMLAGTAAAVYDFDLDALTAVARRIGPRVDAVHTRLTEVPMAPSEAFSTESALEALIAH